MPREASCARVIPITSEPEEMRAANSRRVVSDSLKTYAVSTLAPARIRAAASSGPPTSSRGRTGPMTSSSMTGSEKPTPVSTVGGTYRSARIPRRRSARASGRSAGAVAVMPGRHARRPGGA